jgi:dTDP-4-dehydrorhamnose 3,5-epimerase
MATILGLYAMHFLEIGIAGAWLIEPAPHCDERGRFLRAWCANEFSAQGIEFSPVQANVVSSIARGTVRGFHFQRAPALEAKLVRCTKGAVFDVVLDLRPESASYGKWFGALLTPHDGNMLYIPERCAHGCQALEDGTEIHYMASAFYTPGAAFGVRYDDPAFGIQLPLAPTRVSAQDRGWPLVEQRASSVVG